MSTTTTPPPPLRPIRLRFDDDDDDKLKWKKSRIAVLLVLLVVYATAGYWCYTSLVPLPEANVSNPYQFMESSALNVTAELSKVIGHRYVGTLNEERAAVYLESALMALAASPYLRDDVTVEVAREQVVGSNGLQNAFGFQIANVYNNLTNVVLMVRPKNETTTRDALLVNAHYDSTLGSPGASDCASCVGVGFELARTILRNKSIPLHSPIVFLFNGGEETLMQAAHGFMDSSSYAKNIGAFINIESTGPWGPDVLFQHTDDWTLRAYANVAPYPRGNSVAQDFFELGLIPADTDYRMLKYNDTVPGVDIAFLFDGVAYHTKEDKVERIRRGSLQSMGENVLAAIVEFSKVLGVPGYKERVYPNLKTDNSRVTGQVFFDVASKFMLVYSAQMATVLHNLPLMALLSLSLARVLENPRELLKKTSAASRAVSSAIVLPAAVGAARSLLSGIPISWYGNFAECCAVYLPIAVAGIIMPLDSTSSDSLKDSQGFGVLFSMMASLLMMLGMTSSYVSAAWGAGTIFACILGKRLSYFALILSYVVPCYFGTGVALTALLHVVEKIGISGGAEGLVGLMLADVIVGALSGLCIVISMGSLAPFLAFGLGRRKRFICMALVAASFASALYSSRNRVPYTSDAPKRLIIQHVHRVSENDQIIESFFTACSMDAIPASQPGTLPPALESLEDRPFDSSDWVSFYPLNYLITGVSKRDAVYNSSMDGIWSSPPSIKRASFLSVALDSVRQYLNDGYEAMKIAWNQSLLTAKSKSLKRHYFELDTVLPGWAVLNITANVVNWSMGKEIATTMGKPNEHIARYASGPYTTKWQFWIDVPKESPSIHISLYVKHFQLASHASEMLQGFNEWVSPVSVTTWQRKYVY